MRPPETIPAARSAASSSVRFHTSHFGLTDVGLVRAGNEDAWVADPAQGLFIVADGMGGHNAGEIASKLVVDSLPTMIQARLTRGKATAQAVARRLRSAVSRLSRTVHDRAMADPELHGMGATIVMAMLQGKHAVIVHMGDSRAYLYRGGNLKLLTRDHSVIQDLLDHGLITPEEALNHPARNRITASVGMPGDPVPESRKVPIRAGDRLILCTDGLGGMIPDEQIADVLARCPDREQACREMVAIANAAGGLDNVTVVVIDVEAGTAT